MVERLRRAVSHGPSGRGVACVLKVDPPASAWANQYVGRGRIRLTTSVSLFWGVGGQYCLKGSFLKINSVLKRSEHAFQ